MNLLEYLVVYFLWIWFIMKVYIICCILAQIYISRANWWKKLIFLHGDTASWKLKVDWKISGRGQKWVWPLWSQDSKIACISRSNSWNKDFCCVDTNSGKQKSSFKNLWVVVFKNGCNLGLGTLKSAVSQGWIDDINRFLHIFKNLGKLKLTFIFIGWIWQKMGKGL